MITWIFRKFHHSSVSNSKTSMTGPRGQLNITKGVLSVYSMGCFKEGRKSRAQYLMPAIPALGITGETLPLVKRQKLSGRGGARL